MHEMALMADLIRHVEGVAKAAGAARVTRIAVTLGALSHLTEGHFREHFVQSAAGGVAEGAVIVVALSTDPSDPAALSVRVDSLEVET